MNWWDFNIPQVRRPDKPQTPLSRAITISLLAGCMALPVSAYAAGSISGYKFFDNFDTGNGIIANGVRDDQDILLENHMIVLKQDGRKLTQQLTDDNGYYSFPNLSEGKYQVSINVPRATCSTAPKEDNNSTHSRNINYDITIKGNQQRTVDIGVADCGVIEPAVTPKQACANPSIISVSSGRWDEMATWSTTTWPMTSRLPSAGDRVKVNSAHTVTMPPESVNLGTGSLCNEGTITSSDNTREHGTSDIEIHSRVINNRGKITGKDGVDGNCSVRGVSASNVMLFASSIFVNETTDLTNEALISTGNGGTNYTGVCPEHWNIYAANGGGIEIKAGVIKNYSNIMAGNGGNAGIAYHGVAYAGEGGYIVVSSDNVNESENTGTIITGKGGWSQGYRNGRKYSEGGNVIVNLGDFNGEIVGAPGTSLYGDPIHLNFGANLKIRDFEDVNLYTDEGGTMDFTKVNENTFSNIKVITIATKSLNGEGGSIDLRGVSGKVFKATEKVEIFADNILLDAGVDIRDLIDAPEVVIEKGKLIYHVELNSDSQVVGEPSSTVTIPVNVFNASPKDDSYTFTVTDSEGWTLGTIADVTVKGLQQATVNLDVTLPSKRAATNEITITATSKTKSDVTSKTKIHAMVDAGQDSDEDGHPDVLDHFPNNADEWLDTDSDGIGNNADTDDDNDGMLDTWENQYEELVSVINDAELDADEDGFSNLAEFKADTDPTDPNSKPTAEPEIASLTINKTGEGSITCQGTECAADYELNSEVTLTATPSENYRFSHWSGDCASENAEINVTIDQAKTCTANFVVKPPETATLTIDKIGEGLVTCQGAECAADYELNSEVTLTATPSENYRFTHWSGDCASEDAEINVTVDQAKTCTANFIEMPTYTASGQLNDEQGKPLAGVTIQIGDQTTTTNENGYWEISGLEENQYDVIASLNGYMFKPVSFVASQNTPDVSVQIAAPTSPLEVVIEQQPSLVLEGEPALTYSFELTNKGHETATGIQLVNTLPMDVMAVEFETEAGQCQFDGNNLITCDLLDLPIDQSWVVMVTMKPTKATTLINHVMVDSNEYPQDDDTIRTYVRPYFSVSSWAKPYPVLVGGNMVYHLRVMNGQYSPAIAEEVTVTLTLPPAVSFVAANIKDDMGNCQHDNQMVTCNLNSIEVGSFAKIEITAQAQHSGTHTHTVEAAAKAFVVASSQGKVNIINPVIPGSADLIFLVDITGSMQNDINAVVEALSQIITDIEANGQDAPMVGLITFKDEIVNVTTTDDLRQIIRELQAIKPSGGNERFYCPEASVQAMAKALELINNKGRVILVTDASPHPDTDIDEPGAALDAKEVTFDTFLSGDCETFELTGTLADEVEKSTRRRVRTETQCDTSAEDEMVSAKQVYSCMTEQTDGVLINAEAVKSGDMSAVNDYVTHMMTVLQKVVEQVNPEPVETESSTSGMPKEETDTIVVEPKPVNDDGTLAPPPEPNTHWVFVGSPSGHVVSQPAGIDCNRGEGDCYAYFKHGTELKLIPQAPAGLYFDHWTGDLGCENGEFTVTNTKGCSAIFYGILGYQP